MARGASSKEALKNELLEFFGERAFIASDSKTIRVKYVEDGEPVEIKLTMTAAKDLEGGGAASSDSGEVSVSEPSPMVAEPTAAELEAVDKLLGSLKDLPF